MNEGEMLDFLEKFSNPTLQKTENIIPFLVFDLYQCHMTSSLVGSIQKLIWKSSTSVSDVPHFASLLMLELTHHCEQ